MTWPQLHRAADPSIIRALTRLDEALAALDGTDPETDSIAFDRATDHLVSAAANWPQ